jgi:hypothetical protein
MLEDLLQESENLAYIVNEPVNLDAQTEILALRSSNERLQKQLESATQRDPEKYAPIIRRYQTEIENNLNKIIELESGAGGGGRPPRQPSGIPARDDYQKEKADITKYFSKDAVSSVLRTEQDMTYAAIAVRTLAEMGIKLADYEPGLPQDYKLEVLRRSGQFEEVFKGDDKFARYMHAQGQSMYRAVSIKDFQVVLGKEGRYLAMGMKSFRDFFTKGVPCEDYSNKSYEAYKDHIANFVHWDFQRDVHHKGTQSAFISTTATEGESKTLMEEFDYDDDEAYVIEFKPRGLHYLHAKNTLKEDFPLTGPFGAIEDEISAIGIIDPRDIVKIHIYRKGKLISTETNSNYIRS